MKGTLDHEGARDHQWGPDQPRIGYQESQFFPPFFKTFYLILFFLFSFPFFLFLLLQDLWPPTISGPGGPCGNPGLHILNNIY